MQEPEPATPTPDDSLPPALAAALGLLFASVLGVVCLSLVSGGVFRAYLDLDALDPLVVTAVASPLLVPCAVLAFAAFLAMLGHGAAWAFFGRQARRLSLRLRPGRAASQCAYCHDLLPDTGELHRCGGCAATLHVECFEEAQTCPTLGCPHRLSVVRRVEESSPGTRDQACERTAR